MFQQRWVPICKVRVQIDISSMNEPKSDSRVLPFCPVLLEIVIPSAFTCLPVLIYHVHVPWLPSSFGVFLIPVYISIAIGTVLYERRFGGLLDTRDPEINRFIRAVHGVFQSTEKVIYFPKWLGSILIPKYQKMHDESWQIVFDTSEWDTDITRASWRLKSQPATGLFVQQLVQANNTENTKGPHYWLFVRGILMLTVESPDKCPVIRKTFPFYDVVMIS